MFEIACYRFGSGSTCRITARSYFTANSAHDAIGSSSRFVIGRECEQQKKPHAGLPEFLSYRDNRRISASFGTFLCEKSHWNAREIGRECGLLAKEQSLRHSSRNGDVAEWLKAAVC
jgi:hypothetical protein